MTVTPVLPSSGRVFDVILLTICYCAAPAAATAADIVGSDASVMVTTITLHFTVQ